LVENCDFFIPLAFDAYVRKGVPSEYCHAVWYGKARMVGLPGGEKILRICVRQNTGVWQTDGQTDGRTDRHCHGIVRAMHTRRAVIKAVSCSSDNIVDRGRRSKCAYRVDRPSARALFSSSWSRFK